MNSHRAGLGAYKLWYMSSKKLRGSVPHDEDGDPVLRRVPGLPGSRENLREVLEEQSIAAEVEVVVVNTDGETQELHFAGSPTIRVDSEDLFPWRSERSTRSVAECMP
jgi:hypothetical protein